MAARELIIRDRLSQVFSEWNTLSTIEKTKRSSLRNWIPRLAWLSISGYLTFRGRLNNPSLPDLTIHIRASSYLTRYDHKAKPTAAACSSSLGVHGGPISGTWIRVSFKAELDI